LTKIFPSRVSSSLSGSCGWPTQGGSRKNRADRDVDGGENRRARGDERAQALLRGLMVSAGTTTDNRLTIGYEKRCWGPAQSAQRADGL
jgi:hypothetical protein